MGRLDSATKMPEFIIFAKALLLGGAITELSYVAYLSAGGINTLMDNFASWIRLVGALFIAVLVVVYAAKRGIATIVKRIAMSKRLDLLLTVILGAWAAQIASPALQDFHSLVSKSNATLILIFTAFMMLMMASSIFRVIPAKNKNAFQMYFLADDEIDDQADDVLSNNENAVRFAETVLASGARDGLVYGIDAPWGTGKTSFINLACAHWREKAAGEVIIFRFEPLRYASDPDLAERLIRDLSGEIQNQVFVPEFQPVADRYSRMLKGKADFSFMGFKLSLEPSPKTIDELLDDIDEVLKQNNRRVIIVVDDLDRLEAKAINDVLFTVRRTFRLTQAAYVLCYDTENLVSTKDDGERARQFLEKFVNIKLSLFVDSAKLTSFLRTDWQKIGDKLQSIPSETMLKLASILDELANLLDGKLAPLYMRIVGDMRKLKRFINAVLLMQIEKTDLARTDFNRRDLVNLMLLHLNYPGTFRRIYVEETNGRSGIFSTQVKFDGNAHSFENSPEFAEFVKDLSEPEKFLLKQLFEHDSLALDESNTGDESVRASRACFNSKPRRNLEQFLNLIVRFSSPEPRTTFKLYQDAVALVKKGTRIEDVLAGKDFDLTAGNSAHDEFWRILVSQSNTFNSTVAEDSIDSLVKYLPKYSVVGNSRFDTSNEDTAYLDLRIRSIYTLIRLLDRAGWGRTNGQRLNNVPENIVEIAYRIFGDQKYQGKGLIDRLADKDRGVLGIYDLLLFRLQCSADRGGQIYNLTGSLIVYRDMSASTSGLVSQLAVSGMRTLSQRVFAIFKARYLDKQRNFFDEVDALTDAELFGDSAYYQRVLSSKGGSLEVIRNQLDATRSMIKTFSLFQLINRHAGTGSGVGCGYYDPDGDADTGQISMLINKFLFDVCFDPTIQMKNAEYFLDNCLCNLRDGFFEGDDAGYFPSIQTIAGVFDLNSVAQYWETHGAVIRSQNFISSDKCVTTFNYIATYKKDLPRVFNVLDQIQVQTLNSTQITAS